MHKLFLVAIMSVALPMCASNDPKDYPLRLQIVNTTQAQRANGTVYVHGKATLIDPSTNTSSAVSYSGACSFRFQSAPTAAELMNPAKWKKEGSKLGVLWHRTGSKDKLDDCDLDVYDILPHKAYIAGGGRLNLVTEAQFKLLQHTTETLERDQHPVDMDPTHYPMQTLILVATWREEPYGFSGQGKGNIYEDNHVRAVDFNATCPFRPAGGAGNYYASKWTEPNARLVLLSHTIGDKFQPYQCELTTDTKPFVYSLNPNTGVISNMSQADYKDLLEKKGQPSQLTQAGARPVSDSSGGMAKSVQKLSVNSVPEAADIEVDGAFVGSTPSVLELNTGEHSIVVHKTGYKTWERKLQLATGEIKVTAELEKSASPN